MVWQPRPIPDVVFLLVMIALFGYGLWMLISNMVKLQRLRKMEKFLRENPDVLRRMREILEKGGQYADNP